MLIRFRWKNYYVPRFRRHTPLGPIDANSSSLLKIDSMIARAELAEILREQAWYLAMNVTAGAGARNSDPYARVGQIPAFLAALARVVEGGLHLGDHEGSALGPRPLVATSGTDMLLRAAATSHAEQRMEQQATAREVLEEFAALRAELGELARGNPERLDLHGFVIDPVLDMVMAEAMEQFHGAATRELRYRAERDPLTGLFNRAAFTERLERELAHAGRHGRKLTLVTLDLDAFKSVNDTLGHLAGDAVLKRVAELLETHTREHDLVARVGGDEFVVALTEADAEAARNLVRRVRIHLAPTRKQLDLPAAFGVSFGTSTFPEHGTTIDALLAGADRGMYRDKAGDVAELPGAATAAPDTVADPEEMSKISVLVADDDPAMRELCQATLENSGFAVTLASSGREALQLVTELTPDAIVLDVRMPTMDGWQVAARLAQTEELRQIPVIMLTGLTDQDSLRKADLAGASDYIAKPFDPRQLSDSVHQVLELHHDTLRDTQRELRRGVARS